MLVVWIAGGVLSVLGALAYAELGALLVIGVVLLATGRGLAGTASGMWPAAMSTRLASGMGLGMIGVLWAYEGWQYVTFSAGEAIDPQRTVPRAIVGGTMALVVIY